MRLGSAIHTSFPSVIRRSVSADTYIQPHRKSNKVASLVR